MSSSSEGCCWLSVSWKSMCLNSPDSGCCGCSEVELLDGNVQKTTVDKERKYTHNTTVFINYNEQRIIYGPLRGKI